MDTKALQLASRFALAPNALGFCGKQSAPAKLAHCISSGNCADVAEELKHFRTLWPYLLTIAEISGREPLSHSVVEAYWLGNSILRKARPRHFDTLLQHLANQGVPKEEIERMRRDAPKAFIPFHLWQVLLAGSHNTEQINQCMVRWGKVLEVHQSTVVVDLWVLAETNRLERRETTLKFKSSLVPNLRVGDTIATHWGWVSKTLTQQEARHLSFWTRRVLKEST